MFYKRLILIVIVTGILSHPTDFNLTLSQEKNKSFETFETTTDSNNFTKPVLTVCADERLPLLKGDDSVFACKSDCPRGFDCVHFSEGLIDKGGYCCPNLNELNRLYGENEIDKETSEKVRVDSETDIIKMIKQEKSTKNPINFMESPILENNLKNNEHSDKNVLRFTPAEIHRKEETQRTLSEKQYKSELELETLNNESYSCRRQQLKSFCKDGLQQTQFVMRWFYKEGVCFSYPWGYCPGLPISSDLTLRTKEECQHLCQQPLQKIVDLNISNVTYILGENVSTLLPLTKNIKTENVSSSLKFAAKNNQTFESAVKGNIAEQLTNDKKEILKGSESNFLNKKTSTNLKELDTILLASNKNLKNNTQSNNFTQGRLIENIFYQTGLLSHNTTKNIETTNLPETNLKTGEPLNKKKIELYEKKYDGKAINEPRALSSKIVQPHSDSNVGNLVQSEVKPIRARVDESIAEEELKFYATSDEAVHDEPQKKCKKIIPYRAMCENTKMPSQFTLRWHLHGDKCELYPYGYCHGEAVQDEEPIKSEEECISFCIYKKPFKRSQN